MSFSKMPLKHDSKQSSIYPKHFMDIYLEPNHLIINIIYDREEEISATPIEEKPGNKRQLTPEQVKSIIAAF